MRALLFLILITSQFVRADKVNWSRQIIEESRPNGATLLLVIDIPSNSNYLQDVVFRKVYGSDEIEERRKTRDYYQVHTERISILDNDDRVTSKPLWTIDHPWTKVDEGNYANWIQQNAKPDLLNGTGLVVDCADFAMTLRWIFARENHLPAANSLAGSGKLFGNWASTAKWDNLATDSDWRKDERFKAALRYLLVNSYTHSLFDDAYPVTITSDFVNPGAIYLTLFGASGHTRTITKIGNDEICASKDGSCIKIIFGNEPASENGYVDALIPWKLKRDEGGFIRFRWPEKLEGRWKLRDTTQMPGYSLEQYQWSNTEYNDMVVSRLGLSTTPEEQYVKTGNVVANALVNRLETTERGYFLCHLVTCTKGDAQYEEWSTPQRDHTVSQQMVVFQNDSTRVSPYSEAVYTFNNQWDFPIVDGSPFTFLNFMRGYNGSLGSDPTLDFVDRWGMTDITAENHLRILANVAYDNWTWREDLVDRAQKACFPNGGDQPSCDVTKSSIKKLDTSRLDQAFRAFQILFAQEFQSSPSDVQDKIKSDLQSFVTRTELCGENHCTLYDFLIGIPDAIPKMTSKPDANLKSRFGF